MKQLASSVGIVFRKEMLDGLRDRRSVLSAFLFPLLVPVLILFMFNAMADKNREPDHIELPVVGAQHGQVLIDWLAQRNIDAIAGPDDPESAVREREADLVLVIPDDFGKQFDQGKTADVELVIDSARDEVRPKRRKVSDAINGYSRLIANLRMIARGINPQVVRPIRIEEVEIASAQKRSARALVFIPMYVLMAAFIAGMNIAIDTTAGERERGSLESLLVNPVARAALVLGKWLAAVVFSAAGVVLTLAGIAVAMERVPLHELGLRFQLGAAEIVGILAATLPVAFLGPGLQVLVATFARSYKEAQTYMSILIFIPVVPLVVFSLHSISSESWMYPIPILGQQALLTDVLQGETAALGHFVMAGISSLVASLICVALTAKLFQNERIIFGPLAPDSANLGAKRFASLWRADACRA